jgi:hypothetical protein
MLAGAARRRRDDITARGWQERQKTAMSGPGGMVTKRDQRRESRRDQYQRRQAERQAERLRQIRQQRIRRYGLIGGGIIIVLLLALGISQFIIHNNNANPTGSLNPHPATGQTVDGLKCLPQQGGALHIHQYLDLYVNGQQQTVPPGTGIVNPANCLYPLHVHDNEPNIIHNETDQQNVSFTLGQFFDIWGVKLSSSQVGGYTVDGAHKLVIKLIDKSGNVTTYTGNPHDIPLGDQETIYLLYNSPNVAIKPYVNWQSLGGQ